MKILITIILTFYTTVILAGDIKIGLFFPAVFLDKKYLEKSNKETVFYVIIHNSSPKDLKFWRGRAYSGYKNCSFKISDEDNVEILVKSEDWPMGSEPDRSVIVHPSEFMVLPIHLNEKDWVGFKKIKNGKVLIKAIYCSLAEKRDDIGWTGTAMSQDYEVIISE